MVHRTCEALGLPRDRFSLIADHAGANIATVVAAPNRHGECGERFRHQELIYPCPDLTASYLSLREVAEGCVLTRELYARYRRNHIRITIRPTGVSPLFASASRERRRPSFCAPASIHCATRPSPMRGAPAEESVFPEMLQAS
ncbi:alpha/beta hydrolase [Nordella sp. HKS 07]|uniref:alpha/beta hydrolase fold domain-containing protein n=1 Tax=Nordella sp. HKS 07 TaxID=2712222 RepID=UPI0013E1F727|nr:alpha/beta hydrolase [Nordella sp. HKS 07]